MNEHNKKWRVTGEWIVVAPSAIVAEGMIENAVSASPVAEAELEDCVAELHEDEEEEGTSGELL